MCGSLPKALTKLGVEVDIILPFYRCVRNVQTEFNSIAEDLPVSLGWRQLRADIYQTELTPHIKVFLVARDEFYDRSNIYGTNKGGYFDNGERFAFFAQSVLAFIDKTGYKCDVLHCHDWQTALVPVYLKTKYFYHPGLSALKTVLTIHNLGYQGVFPAEVFGLINLPSHLFSIEGLEFWGQVNFLKGGIIFADFLTTVSPTYAKEIQTQEYGFGLDGVLRLYAHRLKGILNGVDYSEWNPETDPYIAARYSKADLSGKIVCKEDLIRLCGLPLDLVKRPLLGMVSRLVEQKGIEILLPVIEKIAQKNAAVVILGTGEKRYEDALSQMAARYPSQICVKIGFDNKIAHKIIAGTDMFLMPSRYESCGLTQLYSLRYGTIPIVRNTGGLADTITDAQLEGGKGTGFKFNAYSPDAFWEAINRAINCYEMERTIWYELMLNAMQCDFSWDKTAKEYVAIYERILKR